METCGRINIENEPTRAEARLSGGVSTPGGRRHLRALTTDFTAARVVPSTRLKIGGSGWVRQVLERVVARPVLKQHHGDGAKAELQL